MEMKANNQKPPSLQVIVTISGGVGDVLFKSPGVAIALYDYDVEGSDENEPSVSRDPDGQLCTVREWEPAEEVVGPENWPIIKGARQGSYCRTWKCPDCGRTVEHSYEALAEVGTPICTDCDTEMELL
jgi:hypothetical protein